jgi:hypothetical protein
MMWLSLPIFFSLVLKITWAQRTFITFDQSHGGFLLADASTAPVIVVSDDEWTGVKRAAGDLARDVGLVVGVNGTVQTFSTGNTTALSSSPLIIAGTHQHSELVTSLVQQGKIDTTRIQGQWEAYQIQMVANPMEGVDQALVVVGADKRGTIYGLYDISEQMGVSPWYWWADVAATPRQSVYALNVSKVQGSPSVKYRGFFLNDEQPALTNWVNTRIAKGEYGPGFNHVFYSAVYELLLRLRANYLWPAQWGEISSSTCMILTDLR